MNTPTNIAMLLLLAAFVAAWRISWALLVASPVVAAAWMLGRAWDRREASRRREDAVERAVVAEACSRSDD